MIRDPSAALVRALCHAAESAGTRIEIVSASARDWASATFVGARHSLLLAAAPSPALDAWLAALPDADLSLPGQIVAELTIDRDGDGAIGLDAFTLFA